MKKIYSYFFSYNRYMKEMRFVKLFKRRKLTDLYTSFWWDYSSTSRKIIKKRVDLFISTFIYFFSFEFYFYIVFILLFFYSFFNFNFFGFFFNSIFSFFIIVNFKVYTLIFFFLCKIFYLSLIYIFLFFKYPFLLFSSFFFYLKFFFIKLKFVIYIFFKTSYFFIINKLKLLISYVNNIIFVFSYLFKFLFSFFKKIVGFNYKSISFYSFIYKLELSLKPVIIDIDFVLKKRLIYEKLGFITRKKKKFKLTIIDRFYIKKQRFFEVVKNILFFFFFFHKTSTYFFIKEFLKYIKLLFILIYRLFNFQQQEYREFIASFTVWSWVPDYVNGWDYLTWHQTYTFKKKIFTISFYDLRGFLFYIFVDFSFYGLSVYRLIHYYYWEAYFLEIRLMLGPLHTPIESRMIRWVMWFWFIIWKDPETYRGFYKLKAKKFIINFIYLDNIGLFFNFKNLIYYYMNSQLYFFMLFLFCLEFYKKIYYIYLYILDKFSVIWTIYFLNIFLFFYELYVLFFKGLFRIYFFFFFLYIGYILSSFLLFKNSFFFFFKFISKIFLRFKKKSNSFNVIYLKLEKNINDDFNYNKIKYLLWNKSFINYNTKVFTKRFLIKFDKHKLMLRRMFFIYYKVVFAFSKARSLPLYRRFMLDLTHLFYVDVSFFRPYQNIFFKFMNRKIVNLFIDDFMFLFFNKFIKKLNTSDLRKIKRIKKFFILNKK